MIETNIDKWHTFPVSLHQVCTHTLCRSFIRSLCVVLWFLLTVLMIILTPRDEILCGAPDRGRLSVVLYVFHFLTIEFFHTKLLAYCRLTLPSLVQFYNFLPGVLRQLFCLGHGWVWVQTGANNTGNEWRTEELLKEVATGLWEPEILLVCGSPNTYFPP